MAVQLFKDGESQLFPIERYKNALENGGWRLTPEPEPVVEPEPEFDPEPSRPEPIAPTREQADTNKTGKLSAQEVRSAAKTAGLESWDTARIATLKKKLGYDN